MTLIEEKSQKVQVELMGDIITNFKHINYEITAKGQLLRELLSTKTYNEKEKTVTLSKETFDQLLNLAYILQEINQIKF